MARRRYSSKEIVKALRAANGLISVAAKPLGCNPDTIRIRAKKEARIKAAIEEARESMVDLAEQRLRTAVDNGQPWAIALVVKTLGKSRGYVERTEQTGKDGGPIETNSSVKVNVYIPDNGRGDRKSD